MGLDLSPYFWGLVFPNLGSKAYVGIVLELWTYRKPPVSHFKVCQKHSKRILGWKTVHRYLK